MAKPTQVINFSGQVTFDVKQTVRSNVIVTLSDGSRELAFTLPFKRAWGLAEMLTEIATMSQAAYKRLYGKLEEG